MKNKLLRVKHLIQISKCYYPLFEFMQDEHDLILTESELQDLMSVCETVKKNLKKI